MRICKMRLAILGMLLILSGYCVALNCLAVDIYSGHTGFVDQVIISPDGKTLASFSRDDGTFRLWDVATKRGRMTLDGLEFRMAFSPNGQTIAVGGRDGSINFVDIPT